MPQNEYIEEAIKKYGRRLDYEERKRKKLAREAHSSSNFAKKVHGIKAKLYNKKRHAEKIQMKKKIKQHEEKSSKQKDTQALSEGAIPTYLMDLRGIAEDEMFRVWKRMVTKATFVGDGFTRKPPKYERFIRPMALRYKKAHVTHPELAATFHLPIISVKKNPQSPLYTQLGVITKGTVVEVNVSELGLVTTTGKVVWGKYAQVTNNPENDGCINAVLLV
ncbi:21190_t:CDS:2 [Entrophospora sp. SA101]|nr:21190_t:CDS:2 [Entrophospora sp. SA101]